MDFFSLPLYDIVYQNIFQYLPFEQLFRLKFVNKKMEQIVSIYIKEHYSCMVQSEFCGHARDANFAFWNVLKENHHLSSLTLKISRFTIDESVLCKVILNNRP